MMQIREEWELKREGEEEEEDGEEDTLECKEQDGVLYDVYSSGLQNSSFDSYGTLLQEPIESLQALLEMRDKDEATTAEMTIGDNIEDSNDFEGSGYRDSDNNTLQNSIFVTTAKNSSISLVEEPLRNKDKSMSILQSPVPLGDYDDKIISKADKKSRLISFIDALLDANVSDKERELANVRAELEACRRDNKALSDEMARMTQSQRLQDIETISKKVEQDSDRQQAAVFTREAIRAHEESVKWKNMKKTFEQRRREVMGEEQKQGQGLLSHEGGGRGGVKASSSGYGLGDNYSYR